MASQITSPDIALPQITLPQITLPMTEIADFCRRNRIRKLALFGSVLRADFGPQSDVDVLVEFEPEARVGWEFFGMQDELGTIFGRKVDLHTPNSLHYLFRNRVLQNAQVIYERPRQTAAARHAERSAASV